MNKTVAAPKRMVRMAAKAAAIATAAAAVSVTGTLSAGASTTAPARPGVPNGAILVKEVKSAYGVLDVYNVPKQAVKAASVINHCHDNVDQNVCLGIDGNGGTNVIFMQNWTMFAQPGVVNMAINGPNHFVTESGNFYQYGHNSPQDNGTFVFLWYPNNHQAPAGYYCANSFTARTKDGVCITVNSH